MAPRIKIQHSGAALFLMELIVAIGIFSAAAAVCVQLFARAALISRQSADLSHATFCAQSAAESFKAAGGDTAQTLLLLGEGGLAGGVLTVAYDRDWLPGAPGGQAAYLLTLTPGKSGGVSWADIAVVAPKGQDGQDRVLFQIRVATPAG